MLLKQKLCKEFTDALSLNKLHDVKLASQHMGGPLVSSVTLVACLIPMLILATTAAEAPHTFERQVLDDTVVVTAAFCDRQNKVALGSCHIMRSIGIIISGRGWIDT